MILNIDVLGPRILDRVLDNVNGTIVTTDSHSALNNVIIIQLLLHPKKLSAIIAYNNVLCFNSGQRYGILFLSCPYEKKTKKIERSQ